ncbi:MAG TPA: ABC transporter permease [Xanthomonadales bacterium]|nr:ABC transporter permease [Xanthomonadales bacterium]
MNFLFASMRKDLGRWIKDRTAMFIWLGIPFLIGVLITSMMDSGSGTPTGTLLMTDEDKTFISGLVVGAFSQDQLGDLIMVEQVDAGEGLQRINDGDASGFLTIPEGFQDAFLQESPITLTLMTNPSQIILPGIITDVTEILLDLGFYLQRLLGPEIRTIVDSEFEDGPSDAFISGISVGINQKISGIADRVTTPPIELEIVEPPPSEPRPDLALLFLPGIVLMAVLFAANSLAGDYWTERNKRTLRRLVTAPDALFGFVGGKALAVFVIMVAIAGLVLIAGFTYHGVSWAKLFSSLLWVSLGGIGLFAWFAALQMLFPSSRSANLVTTILMFPLLMMGGSFFPLEALPDWIANIGRLSPNGFIVEQLSAEFTSATSWSISARSWLILLAMTVSGLLVSVWRLRSGFARG